MRSFESPIPYKKPCRIGWGLWVLLKAFCKRLQREYGSFAAFWRMSIQMRGAWHFHLLLFVGPSFGAVGELRRYVSRSWYEVTGKVSEGHLRAGTRIVAMQRWREVTSYVERYMAKPEEFPEGLRTGRIWGGMER
jgi:hypothetical protein